MPEFQKGMPHEVGANAFELIAGGLPRHPFGGRFRLEKFSDTARNGDTRPVAAVGITDHTLAVDGQEILQKSCVKFSPGF
jgi:hypothetical protein